MVCALAVGFVSEQLRNSKVGRAWEAIREDEDVAQGMGINTVHYKLLAFGMGAAIGGLGGAIRTSHFSAVTPADFQLIVSINVLAVVIIGGMGSVRGVPACPSWPVSRRYSATSRSDRSSTVA